MPSLATSLAARSALRRKTMTVTIGKIGEEPLSQSTRAMSPGQRMELACLLSQASYALKNASANGSAPSTAGLPRHAWPARFVRGEKGKPKPLRTTPSKKKS